MNLKKDSSSFWTKVEQKEVAITLSGEMAKLYFAIGSEVNSSELCGHCHALRQTVTNPTSTPQDTPDLPRVSPAAAVAEGAKICRDFTLDGAMFRFKVYCAHRCPDAALKMHYELWMLSSTPQQARTAWLQRLALRHSNAAAEPSQAQSAPHPSPAEAAHTTVHVVFSRPSLSRLRGRYYHDGGGRIDGINRALHPVDPDLPPPMVTAVDTDDGLLVCNRQFDYTPVAAVVYELYRVSYASPFTLTMAVCFTTSTRCRDPAPSDKLFMKFTMIDVDDAASLAPSRCSVQ